jgi:hypothetical protein
MEIEKTREINAGSGKIRNFLGNSIMLPNEQEIIQKPTATTKANSFFAIEKLNSRRITS